jgi:hypothetical protein
MSKGQDNQDERKALHIGSVSGSFDLDDVRASIQNALHEQEIGLFKCLSVCDNVLKHLEKNGMVVRNDR